MSFLRNYIITNTMPYGMNTILIFNSHTDVIELNNCISIYYIGCFEVQRFASG